MWTTFKTTNILKFVLNKRNFLFGQSKRFEIVSFEMSNGLLVWFEYSTKNVLNDLINKYMKCIPEIDLFNDEDKFDEILNWFELRNCEVEQIIW